MDRILRQCSALDWGHDSQGTMTDPALSSSAIIRVLNITDPLDESGESRESYDSDDDDFFGLDPTTEKNQKKKCQKWTYRQGLIIIAALTVFVAGAVGVAYAVIDINNSGSNGGSPVASSNTLSDQDLLQIAERVVLACGEDPLNDNMSSCKELCDSIMCCFEKDETNCVNDPNKNCAAHAGCEALVP